MKVPGITIPDVPEAGKIDGDEMLLVLENSELRLKTIDMAKGLFRFPYFAPRLLASLVASSTAACTSGVVTVTATAHGIPATTFDGYSFYYPGSASLAAGWYSGLSRASADALTFLAPGTANFASESVNAGAAFTSEVTFESISLPENIFKVGDSAIFNIYRASNSIASNKTLKIKIGADAIMTNINATTSNMVGTSSFAFFISGQTTAVGHNSTAGVLTGTVVTVACDISAENTISITGQVSVAAQYFACICKNMEIR